MTYQRALDDAAVDAVQLSRNARFDSLLERMEELSRDILRLHAQSDHLAKHMSQELAWRLENEAALKNLAVQVSALNDVVFELRSGGNQSPGVSRAGFGMGPADDASM